MSRLPRNKGFTLAEVLVAVMILSVVLITTIGAMAAARETQRRAGNIAFGQHYIGASHDHTYSTTRHRYTLYDTTPSLDTPFQTKPSLR